jgi:hypothetical protein
MGIGDLLNCCRFVSTMFANNILSVEKNKWRIVNSFNYEEEGRDKDWEDRMLFVQHFCATKVIDLVII